MILFQSDTFELKTLSVGKIISLTVGHDMIGRGNGWYCDKVVIIDNQTTDKAMIFPCHRCDFETLVTCSGSKIVSVYVDAIDYW